LKAFAIAVDVQSNPTFDLIRLIMRVTVNDIENEMDGIGQKEGVGRGGLLDADQILMMAIGAVIV